MTLIPLAIGVLGLKAWNALQLSFISFLVSISLAIFQLCKKVAADSHGSPIAAHIPFETSHYARNFIDDQPSPADDSSDVDAHNLAYSSYAKQSWAKLKEDLSKDQQTITWDSDEDIWNCCYYNLSPELFMLFAHSNRISLFIDFVKFCARH